MKLTENFSLRELTKSNTAERYGIDNSPTEEHLFNLTELCINVLQPLRDEIGLPIRLNSGYRSGALNAKVNGSSSSDHCKGCAADVELWVQGEEDNAYLFHKVIAMGLEFKQMIWEFGDDEQPSWVHIAYEKGNNRKEILVAYKEGTKTKYKRYEG